MRKKRERVRPITVRQTRPQNSPAEQLQWVQRQLNERIRATREKLMDSAEKLREMKARNEKLMDSRKRTGSPGKVGPERGVNRG